jgi:hypothetical protein
VIRGGLAEWQIKRVKRYVEQNLTKTIRQLLGSAEYAAILIEDRAVNTRVGDVRVFGSGDYAMRLWLHPGKIAARSMDVDEVLRALDSRSTPRKLLWQRAFATCAVGTGLGHGHLMTGSEY